jgi:hypothetical protein
MPVLNVYVVHLSDRANIILALILGTCIARVIFGAERRTPNRKAKVRKLRDIRIR